MTSSKKFEELIRSVDDAAALLIAEYETETGYSATAEDWELARKMGMLILLDAQAPRSTMAQELIPPLACCPVAEGL